MVIDKTLFSHMLLTVTKLLKQESPILSEIDSRFERNGLSIHSA